MQATARACSNIAFIKYWGNQDEDLRIPVNSSLSMNLASLYTTTTVTWDTGLKQDQLVLNGTEANADARTRVSQHLQKLRDRFGIEDFAEVSSENNFPMGAGIASSASSFAALTVAAVKAANLSVSERELTTLARLGSGSASRSVPAGFVEWYKGTNHDDSFAETIANPDHWNLVDVVAIISSGHKKVGSKAGHPTAKTSDLQVARVAGAEQRLNTCRQALFDRDFNTFATVVELDSNLMHSVMMTSVPALFYWLPATLTVMDAVRILREDGVNVCYTLDAGPNVHCLCTVDHAPQVIDMLKQIDGVIDIRESHVGGAASIIE